MQIDVCPVCFVEIGSTTTACGHLFCSKCLDRWVRTNPTGGCPLCRGPMGVILRITVIRKCLRKYLKGHTTTCAISSTSEFEKHLEQHMLCFASDAEEAFRMSRNFVVFEYATKRYEVSFKHLNDALRARLYGKTKEEQARLIVYTLFLDENVRVTKGQHVGHVVSAIAHAQHVHPG